MFGDQESMICVVAEAGPLTVDNNLDIDMLQCHMQCKDQQALQKSQSLYHPMRHAVSQ